MLFNKIKRRQKRKIGIIPVEGNSEEPPFFKTVNDREKLLGIGVLWRYGRQVLAKLPKSWEWKKSFS
jgi:hypothetical protein